MSEPLAIMKFSDYEREIEGLTAERDAARTRGADLERMLREARSAGNDLALHLRTYAKLHGKRDLGVRLALSAWRGINNRAMGLTDRRAA